MYAINCGILTEDQKARGWSLMDDEHLLYLLKDGEAVATFNAPTVSLEEVHKEIVCREAI